MLMKHCVPGGGGGEGVGGGGGGGGGDRLQCGRWRWWQPGEGCYLRHAVDGAKYGGEGE